MKYYLKHELIAVTVIDLVPTGLVSQYFFYQNKYRKNRIGVFSALL